MSHASNNSYKKQKFTCEIPTIGICNGNDSNGCFWVVTFTLSIDIDSGIEEAPTAVC